MAPQRITKAARLIYVRLSYFDEGKCRPTPTSERARR